MLSVAICIEESMAFQCFHGQTTPSPSHLAFPTVSHRFSRYGNTACHPYRHTQSSRSESFCRPDGMNGSGSSSFHRPDGMNGSGSSSFHHRSNCLWTGGRQTSGHNDERRLPATADNACTCSIGPGKSIPPSDDTCKLNFASSDGDE